jgi:hypothetical protein
VVTRSILCIKVVAYQSSFNFTELHMVPKLILHTVNQNSDFRLTDSPTLGLIISKFFMTPRLNPFSKIVLVY